MYKKDLGYIYRFLSTYKETIFLRQVVNNNGVKYSPVVLSSTTYDRLMTTPPIISMRHCQFYVGLNVLSQGLVNNILTEWIIDV